MGLIESAPREVISQAGFRRMIALEQKRTERTLRPIALLLIDAGHALPAGEIRRVLDKVLDILQVVTRETDFMGWHEAGVSVGAMFTEITADDNAIFGGILTRISAGLREKLTAQQFSQIRFTYRSFAPQSERIGPASEKNAQPPVRGGVAPLRQASAAGLTGNPQS